MMSMRLFQRLFDALDGRGGREIPCDGVRLELRGRSLVRGLLQIIVEILLPAEVHRDVARAPEGVVTVSEERVAIGDRRRRRYLFEIVRRQRRLGVVLR